MLRRSAVLALSALAALTACSDDDAAPTPTSVEDTGTPTTEVAVPEEQLVPLAAGESFDLTWPGETCAEPVAGQVALVDPATGSVIWTTDTPRSSKLSLVTNGSLVWHVTDTGGTTDGLVALDATTGAPVWQRQFAESLFEVQLTTSSLVVGTMRGMIAYDPATGEERWRRTAVQGDGFAVGQVDDVFGALPLSDTVYVNDGGTVLALDAATGEVRWQKATSGDWSYAPNVLDGTVWQVAYEREVLSLDAESGAVNWWWTADDAVTLTNVQAIGERTLVVATIPSDDAQQAELIGLDRATGEVTWRSPITDPYGSVRSFGSSGLLVHGGSAAAGDLTALDLDTGEVVWQGGDDALGYLDTSLDSTPPVLVLDGEQPVVEAIDPATGTPIWSIEGAGTALAVHGESVLLGFFGPMSLATDAPATDNGVLASVNATSGEVAWAATLRYPVVAVTESAGGLLAWAPAPALACG